MDQELTQRLERLEAKVDATYASAEKMRKYFLWTLIISVVVFIVPLIGLVFALPAFMSNYVGSLSGAGLGF
jgi:hypothetical protein